MLSFPRFSILATLLALAGQQVYAQNDGDGQETFITCGGSIRVTNYAETVMWDVNDPTSVHMDVTYNYTLCAGNPLSGRFSDFDAGTSVKCTGPTTFDASNSAHFVCPTTQGEAAREALANGDDRSYLVTLGARPFASTIEYVFTIDPTDSSTVTTAPSSTATTTTTTLTPSAGAARRRRALETQSVLAGGSDSFCEAGKTVCQIKGRKGLVSEKCVDTQRDLFACGGCPGEPASQDCSEIAGVANVQCVSGACRIKACDRSHKLSADGLNCIPKGNDVKMTFY